MPLSSPLIGLLLALVMGPETPDGPGLPPVSQNAALQYWQGQVFLPRWADMTKEEQDALNDPVHAPLHKPALDLIARGERALQYISRGAAMDHCDWGLALDEGPFVLLSHVDHIRPAERLLILRARDRIRRGDGAGAVSDLVAEIRLGRHFASDQTMIGLLIGYSLGDRAAQVIAENLGQLDPESLRRLGRDLRTLPEIDSMSDRLRVEQVVMLGWLRGKIRAGVKPTVEVLTSLIEGSKEEAQSALRAELREVLAKGTEYLTPIVDQAQTLYDEAADLLELPPAQFDAAAAPFQAKLDAANPVVRALFVPFFQFKNLRVVEAKDRARLAMLRAAIAAALDGPEAARQVPDPFGDGPFSASKDGDTLTLTSALKVDGKPFAMTFKMK